MNTYVHKKLLQETIIATSRLYINGAQDHTHTYMLRKTLLCGNAEVSKALAAQIW